MPEDQPLTRTEIELEQARQWFEKVQAKAAQERTLLADASVAMRALAIALHNQICTDEHPTACNWPLDSSSNDPIQADWVGNEAHKQYLFFTSTAIAIARANGWTISEPAAP
jgi:hypothetical protein